MGRITIFTIDQCRHCQRTKNAFKDSSLPFTEISLTSHPNRRTDMLSLTDRLTLPQVLFNEKSVGGADETLALLKEWEQDSSKNLQQRFQEEIASQPDPKDPRLRESTDPPVQAKEPLPREESDKIQLPDGSRVPVLQVMQRLELILSGESHRRCLTVYKHSFSGAAGVQALQNEFNVKEAEAIAFGNTLLEAKILRPVAHDTLKLDSAPKSLYRLQCFHTPRILNSYRVWTTSVDPDTMSLIHRLKKILGKIESTVTNEKGEVDYRKASEDENYPVLEENLCELQCVDLSKLDHSSMLAFGINLYNLMITYSFMKVGIYNNLLAIASFFNVVKFNVGGYLFSFHDWESGILRGNRPAPYTFSPPIPAGDERLPYIIKKVDCRIHFGLNCGAKSCPPVKSFTAEGIEEELRIVAMSFCEDDGNVHIDPEKHVLSLSQIINWYRIDFASSNKDLPKTILGFLRGQKKETLQKMMDTGKTIKIKFKPYDWTTNASDFVPFQKSRLYS